MPGGAVNPTGAAAPRAVAGPARNVRGGNEVGLRHRPGSRRVSGPRPGDPPDLRWGDSVSLVDPLDMDPRADSNDMSQVGGVGSWSTLINKPARREAEAAWRALTCAWWPSSSASSASRG